MLRFPSVQSEMILRMAVSTFVIPLSHCGPNLHADGSIGCTTTVRLSKSTRTEHISIFCIDSSSIFIAQKQELTPFDPRQIAGHVDGELILQMREKHCGGYDAF